MTTRTTLGLSTIAAAAIAATFAFAESPNTPGQMQGNSMMNGMMGNQMAGMMQMMQGMAPMMEACTSMMQAMAQQPGAAMPQPGR